MVTGATGYVGSGLVGRLLDDGWRVRVLLQPGTESDLREPERCAALVGDLLDPAAVEECVAGADVVFHTAGVMPQPSAPDLRPVNVDGTRVVTRAAVVAGVPRLVLMSSAAVYAPAPQSRWPLDEHAPLRTRTAWGRRGPAADFMRSIEDYAWSKEQAEDIVRSAHDRHGLDGVVVRCTEVYGPWRRWFASFVDRALDDPAALYRPRCRAPSMQWLHLDDLIDLLLRAARTRSGVLTVNAAGPEVFAEVDLARLVVPDRSWPRAVPARTPKYSTERARRRLGWVPRVPLAEGMRELLAQREAAR